MADMLYVSKIRGIGMNINRWYNGEISMYSHLNERKVGYCEHFVHSLQYAKIFGVASLKAVAHAILPCVYTTASTDFINEFQNTELHMGSTEQVERYHYLQPDIDSGDDVDSGDENNKDEQDGDNDGDNQCSNSESNDDAEVPTISETFVDYSKSEYKPRVIGSMPVKRRNSSSD